MKKRKMTSRVYEEAAREAYQKYSNTIFPALKMGLIENNVNIPGLVFKQ